MNPLFIICVCGAYIHGVHMEGRGQYCRVISFARGFKTELRPSGVGNKHFYPHRTLTGPGPEPSCLRHPSAGMPRTRTVALVQHLSSIHKAQALGLTLSTATTTSKPRTCSFPCLGTWVRVWVLKTIVQIRIGLGGRSLLCWHLGDWGRGIFIFLSLRSAWSA